jgi:hypothetical protein
MAGYSGTPLPDKLGIQSGHTVCVIGAPKAYERIVTPLPDDVTLTSRISSRTDVVHVFSKSRSDLEKLLQKAAAAIKPNAAIWVSWPKKSAKITTDLTEDIVRAVALPLGLVDVKVCAVDDVWSGLKLVIRRELRKKSTKG